MFPCQGSWVWVGVLEVIVGVSGVLFAFCGWRVVQAGAVAWRGAEFAHANLRVCTFRGEKWVQELGEIGSKSPCARKPG